MAMSPEIPPALVARLLEIPSRIAAALAAEEDEEKCAALMKAEIVIAFAAYGLLPPDDAPPVSHAKPDDGPPGA